MTATWRVKRLLLAGALLLSLAAPAAAKAPVTAVGVSEREFHISPYRTSVAPGTVKFNVHNFGEDTHNLVILGPKGFVAVGPDVDSEQNASFTVKLKTQGTYTLLCTRADHAKLGMKTRFKVKKKS
jgi:plastocyanin